MRDWQTVYLNNPPIVPQGPLPSPVERLVNLTLEPLLAMATITTSAAEAKDLVRRLQSDPDNVDLHQLVRGACTAEAWSHMSEAGYVEFFIEYMGSYEHGDMRSVRVPSITRGSNACAVTDLVPDNFSSLMINRNHIFMRQFCRTDFQHGVYQHGASLSLFKPPIPALHPSVSTRSTFAHSRIYALQ